MTRILALGHGPLPFENTQQGFAPGKRAWQLISPLLDQGHDVCLIASRITSAYPAGLPPITRQQKDRFLYYSLTEERFHQLDELKHISDEFQPDCVIGITVMPASIAASLNLPLPLWADLYGSVMAEAQIKARVYHDDVYLRHFFQMEYKALSRADVFSAVSERQRYALIGELGLYGRLNQWTVGHELIYTIPAGTETTPFDHTHNVIRGKYAGNHQFVVLYSGSYNTWTDINTLFDGLEASMAENDRIVFVSTGGAIAGHDEETYPRFERMIAQSPFRDRFFLCGWVPWRDVHNYYLESDVGVNVDKICYEALLGSRTRVLDWMRAGLPVVTTTFSEVTEHVVRAQAGFAYEALNPENLRDVLAKLADNPSLVDAAAENGKTLLDEMYSFSATTRELQKWVEKPEFAPDYTLTPQPLIAPYHLVSNSHNTPPIEIDTTPNSAVRSDIIDIFQPFWQGLIHGLYQSRFAFLVKPLRFLSKNVKKLRPAIYGVAFETVVVPPQITAGACVSVPLKIVNIGRLAWQTHTESVQSVNISYHWRTLDNRWFIRDGHRTPLPTTIHPRQQLSIDVQVYAPPTPGDYMLEFDLLQEHVAWFSEMGANTYTVQVQVSQ